MDINSSWTAVDCGGGASSMGGNDGGQAQGMKKKIQILFNSTYWTIIHLILANFDRDIDSQIILLIPEENCFLYFIHIIYTHTTKTDTDPYLPWRHFTAFCPRLEHLIWTHHPLTHTTPALLSCSHVVEWTSPDWRTAEPLPYRYVFDRLLRTSYAA